MSLAENVRAFWVSKLGIARLAELAEDSAGGSPLDKARALLRKNKEREFLYGLIIEGFDGYFHQSVFVRSVDPKVVNDHISALGIGQTSNRIEWWSRNDDPKHIRVLAGVHLPIEFLTAENRTVTHTISIPAMIELVGTTLRIRTLTVQSTASTWSQLVGVSIRRLLTSVIDSELAERLMLSVTDPEHLGEMQDLSSQAIDLMKDTDHVYTYAGTLMFQTVGRSTHATEGGNLRGRRRQPLHRVMQAKFKELVSADKIRNCDIEIYESFQGLTAGTALALYPIEGKIVFRRMLGGGAVNDFLAYLAR
jgi:hypothetical protein